MHLHESRGLPAANAHVKQGLGNLTDSEISQTQDYTIGLMFRAINVRN
jgi:hypothetical protein